MISEVDRGEPIVVEYVDFKSGESVDELTERTYEVEHSAGGCEVMGRDAREGWYCEGKSMVLIIILHTNIKGYLKWHYVAL